MPAACAKKFPGNLARRPVGASVDARARAPVDCRERAINERRGCNWRAAFCAGGGRRRDVLRTACFSRVVVVAAAVFIYRGTRPRKRGVRPNDAPVIYGLLRYTCFVAAALKRLCRKNNRFPSPPPGAAACSINEQMTTRSTRPRCESYTCFRVRPETVDDGPRSKAKNPKKPFSRRTGRRGGVGSTTVFTSGTRSNVTGASAPCRRRSTFTR